MAGRGHSLARQILVGAAGAHELGQLLPHDRRHLRPPASNSFLKGQESGEGGEKGQK